MRAAPQSVFALVVLCASVAHADESDLDRIPQALPQSASNEPESNPDRKIYLQNDAIAASARSRLAVPFPPPRPASWEERLFLDARIRLPLADGLSFVYSGRLNLRAEDTIAIPSHEDVRHDLREAYLAWTPADGLFLQLGRFNMKSGVALGFNPTDFFKTRAVVEPLSADPSALREDRLGTFMLFAQKVWDGGTLTAAVAPKLSGETAIYGNTNLPSFNPVFDRTNGRTRVLVKGSFDLADDFSPEFLFYSEGARTEFGLNLTRGVGQSTVAYVEWAGGDRANLVADALRYGIATHTIPAGAPAPFPTDAARGFHSDLAAGASYTTETKITFNLEYHYHQAGFSNADWRNWFLAGRAGIAPLDAELWYIRGYAADQQEPLARSSAFFRFDRQDAFVPDLELSGFVNADLRDASGLAQVSADYYLSQHWTIGVLTSGTFGGKHTDFGSLPGALSAMLKVSRYF